MSLDIQQSDAAVEGARLSESDAACPLFREAQAGMLVLSNRQWTDMQRAQLPTEFGQLVLVVKADGTAGQLVRPETVAEKAQREADQERERQAEADRRRAQEAERQAQEAQRRAQEAERKAQEAQQHAREAQQLASEALQHAEQAEKRAQLILKEMQSIAQSIASLMQLAAVNRAAGH